MVTESGLKLRTRLESAKILKCTTDAETNHKAGDMIMLVDTIGVVVEDVGPNSDFILVYEAEKIVVPKFRGDKFYPGQDVYFMGHYVDGTTAGCVTFSNGVKREGDKANPKCGIALELADESADEVLIDLMVLA